MTDELRPDLTHPVLEAEKGHPSTPCPETGRPAPCTLVIFGASGDLTARKLIPALFHLFCNGSLPQKMNIVGVARSKMTTEDFRAHAREGLEEHASGDLFRWPELAARLFYHPLEYGRLSDYLALERTLRELDEKSGTEGNRIFYLATPPSVYAVVAEQLGAVGLAEEAEGSFSRIVVEKPFGRDLASARELDARMHTAFAEHQIFRIDHYLAKEMVQNILMFRFANSVFEPLWNRRYIASITCASVESLGVGHRAGYYEQAGVLRDMFQNHMMQLLALSAIEPPSLFAANRVRDEKVKLYRSLRPFDGNTLWKDLSLGQYASGKISGRAVPAYRQERGIAPDSMIPTFAMIRAYVDNWRWQGVPFYIMSGKRLPKKLTRIVIQFRDVPHSMFRNVEQGEMVPNRLVLDLAPDNGISLRFQAKMPGSKLCFRPVVMHYSFDEDADGVLLDAYAKVFLDCMLGDQLLFWRQDSVELCWGWLTPILELCEECTDLQKHLEMYPAGSWGPESCREYMECLL